MNMLFREIGKDKMGILITKVMTEKAIFQINASVQFHRWANISLDQNIEESSQRIKQKLLRLS